MISVSSSVGSPQILYTVHEAIKLLGISSENNNQLLLLLKRTEGGFELGELELNSGQVKRLPSDTPDNPDHRLMLRYLRGDDRKYDGISVYIQTESKARLGGKTEWTDIYIKQGDKPATNISRCAGYNCSQPSISFDRSRVAFIRSNEQY